MSHPTQSPYPSWVPAIETSLSEQRETLLLAVTLIASLMFVTPALALATGLPPLVFVLLIGAGYGGFALVLRQLIPGIYAALVITSTFAANVPLASSEYLSNFIGNLGPEAWLAQAPLAALAIYFMITTTSDSHDRNPSIAEMTFGGFVVWASLTATFGTAVRPNAALFFTFLMFQALVVFVAVRHAVQTGVMHFRTVVEIFALVIGAHSVVAAAQFFNRGILGVGQLGELARKSIATVSLGPFGEYFTGTFVAGFTGMSFILGTLIAAAAPIVLALAVENTGWRRWVLVASVVFMAAIVRVTGGDAARGAFIVSIVAFAAVAAILVRRGMVGSSEAEKSPPWQRAIPTMFTLAAGAGAILYPSSKSGKDSNTQTIDPAASASTGATSGGGGESSPATESVLEGVTVPFFDLSTMGNRIQQVIIGFAQFTEHPIFGIGAANFVYSATDLGLPKAVPLHNIYVALLAETGLPGFVLFVGTLLLVLWSGWRALEAIEASDRLLLGGVLAGLLGVLAFQGLGYSLLAKIPVIYSFWILAGAVVGISRR